MGDFRVMDARVELIIVLTFGTILRSVVSTGLGKCPIYPQLPGYDITRVSTKAVVNY